MAAPEVRLSREMRLTDITMIGVGAMIGAGIFVLTGIAAGVAGPGLLLVFLLNGLVTLFAAAAYAELGSCFHEAGGGYLYVKTGLKDPHGFMSGWMSWFAYVVACSLYALGFGAYMNEVLPMIGMGDVHLPFMATEKWMAVGLVLLFCYINYRGASEAGNAGNVVTVAKIIILAIFIGFGIWATVSRPNWQATFTDNFLPNGFGHIFMAMGLTFIAFEGYEIIAQCSEEVQNPERNVPRAIFLSLAIVVPIYLLVAFVAIGAVRPDNGMTAWDYLGAKKETALVDVARTFFKGGGILILIGGLFSTMSALNATIYSSSRVSFAMGRDRNLPSWFGDVHPVRKTPHWSILASGLLSVFMAVALPIETVASAANILFLLLFIQVLVALINLRKLRPDLKRGFTVPWVPLVPIVGIIAQLSLAVYLFFYSPMAWVTALVWIGLGLAVFYGYARKRDRSYAQLVAVRKAASRRNYRILVCIGDSPRDAMVLKAALAVARHYNGELIALTVIEVEEGELLAQGLDSTAVAEARLSGALSGLGKDTPPIKSVVKISHRISFGITETALEEKCNLIVMGRKRRVGMLERLAATALDRVVRSAPAQVMVISGEHWPDEIKSILVPYAGGPNAELATDLAGALAGNHGASLQALHVLPQFSNEEAFQKARTVLAEAFEGRAVEQRIVRSGDVLTGLLRESGPADLIAIGGSNAGPLEQFLGFELTMELADRTRSAVVTVYEMADDPKRWVRE